MRRFAMAGLTSFALFACGGAPGTGADADRGAISSEHAKILDFTFSAELVASRSIEPRTAIVAQLMYSQGILTTALQGNGQVGNVSIAGEPEVTPEGDNVRIKYRATLPVAWDLETDVPSTYEIVLPLDTTRFDAFNDKYDGRCGRNEYGRETFWHDFNPSANGCRIDDADVVRARATVAPSALATSGKYPEYDLIWQDDRLDVVAIFGIISSNTPNDWGYGEARRFTDASKALLSNVAETDNAPSHSILQDKSIVGRAVVGGQERTVNVTVLVVEELASVGRDFDERYDALSEGADLILYNGHAGLGKNVNALARKGKVARDKYQLVLLNGCQSFAYIDTTLTDRRREINGADADPRGTRFLDVIGNALPGYASNLASMSNMIFGAVVGSDQPKHYGQIMERMPGNHYVVVFGEEDNRFAR